MLTLISLTIWLRWEQAGSIGFSFTDRGEYGAAGTKMVAVDPALLVVVDVALLDAVDLVLPGARWWWWIWLLW